MASSLCFTLPESCPALQLSPQERASALALLRCVQQGEPQYAASLGWHQTAIWAGDPWLAKYEDLAHHIRRHADAFVVIGVGGSNQAARAIVEALPQTDGPAMLWSGNTLSPYEQAAVLKELDRHESVYINVIAKNFETLEPGVAFRVLRHYLQERYPQDWQQRIIATGTPGSHLQQLCQDHGFVFLPFPPEIGGRFTALSPVGLLPMAVAGADIRRIAQGAMDMEAQLKADATESNPALRYALARNALYRAGYRMEMLSFFEPRMVRFSKWWTQLFAESEGKQGLGLYPIVGSYSEDLHSIGQFVQEGTPVIFETFLQFREPDVSVAPLADQVDDRFDYLNGKTLFQINQAACQATFEAHRQQLPCLSLSVAAVEEYTFGQLFYFYSFVCYLSGRLLGVNPFDQPGVEAYKARMFEKLGKQ